MSFYRFAQQVVLFIVKFKYKIIIQCKEKLPEKGGFIIASNHQSNLDPLFIGLGSNRTIRFMAKDELFKNKILAFIMRNLGSFPVTRGTGDHSAVDKAIEIVQTGEVLGIFPEGTRSKDGVLKRAKSGIVVVASKTGGDIMPVGIKYGKKLFIRRELTIKYGDLIKSKELHIEDNNKNDLKAACKLVMDNIAALI